MQAIATASLPSRRVLLIEDDPDDAFLIKKALQALERDTGAGFRLTHLRNGLEAISFVGRSDVLGEVPDVIIVDLNMPIMDGQKFIGALRSLFGLTEIRTVVLTTSDQQAIHDAAKAAGANAVFVKPNKLDELIGILQTVVAGLGAGEAAALH
jgi:two-component system, chemotaxis family, chemotaxis protein CheY